jgi:hypothetical protein
MKIYTSVEKVMELSTFYIMLYKCHNLIYTCEISFPVSLGL